MVHSCCVVGCTNRFVKGSGIRFFRFPRAKKQRKAWTKAINRKNFLPKEHSRVCSTHFVSGWPDEEPDEVDFAPTVFVYKRKPACPRQVRRNQRLERRSMVKMFEEAHKIQEKFVGTQLNASVTFHDYCQAPQSDPSSPMDTLCSDVEDPSTHHNGQASNMDDQLDRPGYQTTGTMTEDDFLSEINKLRTENEALKLELKETQDCLKQQQWSSAKLIDDDKATQFYTGLPSYAVFLWLFKYLEPKASRMSFWNGEKKTRLERQRKRDSKLTLIDQFLSVLIRLKVGLFVKDVADRFGISVGTYSKIFNTWIALMQREMALLNPYPSRELVLRYLPSAFRKYPRTRIIVDCTEIFVEKPSALLAQNETFSNYKHHNTLKFLVGISPGGVFTFISKAWGGRVSDREIVKGSGFLDLIEPGDHIMADKGFVIEDLLAERQASLNIPPFLSQQTQFTAEQVQQTRDIAEVRIHVERAIGRLKNFHILKGILPLSLQHCTSDIVSVCAFLTNLGTPIVPTT